MTADNILRDQFSLRIGRDLLPDTYNELVSLFSEYQRSIGRASSYDEVAAGKSTRLFLVPPFDGASPCTRDRTDTGRSSLGRRTRNHVRMATHPLTIRIIAVGSFLAIEVTLTPVTVPVSIGRYFKKGIRRVYLSATLSASDAFARAFEPCARNDCGAHNHRRGM